MFSICRSESAKSSCLLLDLELFKHSNNNNNNNNNNNKIMIIINKMISKGI